MTRRLHADGKTILYGGLSGLAATLYTVAIVLLIAVVTRNLQSSLILAEESSGGLVPLWGIITLYLLGGSSLGSVFAVAYHYWPTRVSIMKALVLVLAIGTVILAATAMMWKPSLNVIEFGYLYLLVYAVGLGWIYSRTKTAPG